MSRLCVHNTRVKHILATGEECKLRGPETAMNLSEGFRVGITAIVIITMAMVEAPIITTLAGYSLFIAGTPWVLMIIGSYIMGRVLSEQFIKDNQ